MLPKDNRLAKTRDFNLLLKRGFWVKGDSLSLKVLNLAENRDYFPPKEEPNSFEKQLRLAFSVGLKISKKAVERNRLKRQLRESVRAILQEGKVKNGYYIMVNPGPSIKSKDYAAISEEMKLLFARAKLLK